MCGIAGLLRHDNMPVDPGLLDAMADSLEHRGPDGRGTWSGDGAVRHVGLAHTRLSIIDPSGSPQPMASVDGRYVISFNGEILNHRELRRSLSYPWRTNGDTEVLLAAFAHYGCSAFEMLAGQFACAIVDTLSGDVWLARDRLGILPLYWTDDGTHFAFASEPKALAAVSGRFSVDPQGLDDYLMSRAVHAPRTLYAGVSKLPAGTFALVRQQRPLEVTPYWQLDPCPSVITDDAQGCVSRLDTTLQAAVRRALIADVEVGAYLSGGLDSSLVTALIVSSRPKAARTLTFSAGFGDPRMDELPYARWVAERLGTEHHEVHVREEDYAKLWSHLSWHRDAPLSEPADVAMFRLAEAARQHVKVVLSGEGSDELFGGYPKHAFAGISAAAARLPSRARAAMLTLIERGMPPSSDRLRIALRALTGTSTEDVFAGWFSPFTATERERLTGRRPSSAPVDSTPGVDALTRMLLQDCQGWLSDNLLERDDRMSMAASLEMRPPFLDRDVVDLAFSLPSSVKIRAGQGKWVVKEVARKYLPSMIVDRRKSGFRVPLDAWFRTGLKDMAWDLLTDPASLSATVLDSSMVRQLLKDHDSGRRNEDIRLWTLLSLEVWHRACILDYSHPTPQRGGRR
jgi:asparagine synthase (glutamine-hydrolysing)